MSKFIIDKSFNFAYGHRVWVQKLREEFCADGDTGTKCRWPHGHEGMVKVFVESCSLNPQAMVMDFKELGFVKDFLDNVIDHKFIVDRNDPVFSKITNGTITGDYFNSIHGERFALVPVNMPGTEYLAGFRLDVSAMDDTPDKEFYEGFFIVDFIPTSENLSKWLFYIIQSKLDLIGVTVNRIEWNETPKSRAVFSLV